MYSSDLRYHWLLNGEKGGIEDFHCSNMSFGNRPHSWLVMKKLDGITPPTLVSAEEGKKGLPGPPPSACMLRGGISGFMILFRECARYRLRAVDATGKTNTTKAIPR